MSEIQVRTRLLVKVFDTFERLALAEGKKVYSALQEAVNLWIRVRLGNAEDYARIHQELADLEYQGTTALADVLAERQRERERITSEIQATQERERVAQLHPAKQVVVLLNEEKVQEALDLFGKTRAKGIRTVILDHVREQPGLPGAEEFLARAEGRS